MKNVVVSLGLLSVFGLPRIGFADIANIAASVDGAVQSSGVLGLSVFDEVINRTLRSGGSNIRHSIYEFDLSTIPTGSTLNSASLNLTTAALISNTGSVADVDFLAFTGDGTITTADFAESAIQVASEAFTAGGAGPPSGTQLTVSFSNLSPLQSVIDDAGSNFAAVRTETVNFVTLQIHSLENTGSFDVPTLNFDFTPAVVPEPTSLSMLVFAGVFTASIRRRRSPGSR